jgi:carboxyl-terminal processing protease
MRRFLVFLLASAVGSAQYAAVAAHQADLDSFEYVWKTVRDKHWDPDLGGLDWQAVHDQFRPRIEKSENIEQTRQILTEMLDTLKLSHYRIIPGAVYSDLSKEASVAADGSVGLDVRIIDGQAVVSSVDPNFPAKLLGIKPGWIISKIGSIDIAALIKNFTAVSADSTLRDLTLRRAVLSRLEGIIGHNLIVEFLDEKDQLAIKTLTREPPKGTLTTLGFLGPAYVWLDARKIKDGDSSIEYTAFNMFLAPDTLMPAFADAVQSCLKCDGFIVDLRGNPGGLGAMAMGLANWFVDQKDLHLGSLILRDTALKFVLNPRPETYAGPLAVLVDDTSASTAEIFAGGLQDLKRARIFGSRTAAAALPSVIEKLPNGDAFQYAIANYVSEGGRELEGNGVTPYVETPLTRAALLAGKDPALDAALQWIRTQKPKHE